MEICLLLSSSFPFPYFCSLIFSHFFSFLFFVFLHSCFCSSPRSFNKCSVANGKCLARLVVFILIIELNITAFSVLSSECLISYSKKLRRVSCSGQNFQCPPSHASISNGQLYVPARVPHLIKMSFGNMLS